MRSVSTCSEFAGQVSTAFLGPLVAEARASRTVPERQMMVACGQCGTESTPAAKFWVGQTGAPPARGILSNAH